MTSMQDRSFPLLMSCLESEEAEGVDISRAEEETLPTLGEETELLFHYAAQEGAGARPRCSKVGETGGPNSDQMCGRTTLSYIASKADTQHYIRTDCATQVIPTTGDQDSS